MTISQRRQRTRSALQDAALTVFARRGVAGASIEEICEEGGFTRGAFYSNYATKDELVLALIDEEFALAVAGASDLKDRLDGGPDHPPASGAEDSGAEGSSGDASRADLSGAVAADGPDAQRDVLRRALEQFRFPFSSTPTRIIAMRDIEVHSLRHPELRMRLDAVTRTHKERLYTMVSDILTHYGARSTVPLSTLVDICHSCYDTAAKDAVVAHPDADTVDVDRSMLLTVLVSFVEFPQECRSTGSAPA